ncbi:carboxylesterase [bacterium B17]|nr:carboxylesterase [bacterium B17]
MDKFASTTLQTIPVTYKNFPRAETHKMFASYRSSLGKISHMREPVDIDKQNVIRMNRDTLYSYTLLDLNNPATITKPETDGRFQSMIAYNEDQYIPLVAYKPGKYVLTKESIGSRYVIVAFRTLVNPNDSEDIKEVHAIQDQIELKQASPGIFEIPDWDKVSLDKVRNALLVLAETMEDYKGSFGSKDEVDPVKYLIGSASGWGGNPTKDTIYVGVTPKNNDGKTAYTLDVKDVPVDGFWSVSLYNAKGYYEKNEYNAYSINNITGKRDKDGVVRIHFGGDPQKPNYLPIMPGWNYLIRMYQPHKKVLKGTWSFPEPVEVK